jgi:hypothetical protein
MFNICFFEPEIYLEGGALLLGKVQINEQEERFAADLKTWSKEEYITHWNASSTRFNAENSIVLFCCARGNKSSNIWATVPTDGKTLVYNSILMNSSIEFIDHVIVSNSHEEFFRSLRYEEASSWELD